MLRVATVNLIIISRASIIIVILEPWGIHFIYDWWSYENAYKVQKHWFSIVLHELSYKLYRTTTPPTAVDFSSKFKLDPYLIGETEQRH